MANSTIEVAIVGGGAAGIAAGRRLSEAGIQCLVVEARPRLGGRAWTVDRAGFPIDLGCGWLHSADRNPWRKVAQAQGCSIDKTPPPWMRPSLAIGFPRSEQQDFGNALGAFFARLDSRGENEPDAPAATLLEADCRWNNLINAVSTYISGVELDRQSVEDFYRYDDNGINWRVVEGYGSTIAAYGADLPVMLDCAVQRIDHRAKRLCIETAKGAIEADQAIITIPTTLLAEERLKFTPALPDKTEAAAGLPLGLADKLFLSLEGAEEFEADTRLFGRIGRAGTGAYHFRPFGRPQIEVYFGGRLASALETGGEGAFFDFAVAELTSLLGTAFARRISPIQMHRWGADPFSRGSYSFALPGRADCRQALAEPVDDRLFFAGEACSRGDFSTAHGAFLTGVAAADRVIALRTASHRYGLAGN
ncbi:MAG TPA: NAD(P)/FAD-dependent oxidoreductase [Xanthobacteraceae bacterium]|nr:NAD(P)/FAD-dependent oxidoreductase [Xanthobacteraceae bacterium]